MPKIVNINKLDVIEGLLDFSTKLLKRKDVDFIGINFEDFALQINKTNSKPSSIGFGSVIDEPDYEEEPDDYIDNYLRK